MARVGVGIALVLLVLAGAWAALALWFDGPAARPLAGALVAVWLGVSGLVLWRVRPLARGLAVWAVLVAGVLGWWFSIEPRNDREWGPDVAQLPSARLAGDVLTVENVRNFEYRSDADFTPRWETRRYDLSKLEGIDLFVSYWGSPLIAHTFVSWVFEDGAPLTVSIETRKEADESYSAIRGFFRQFELYYVVSDENDVARVRTDHRGEDVYLYRLRASPELARRLLLEYVDAINGLTAEPVWYNALVHNCTTTIRRHIRHVIPDRRFDWRILVNGYLDQSAYERGTINTDLPFEEIRARSYVSERARSWDGNGEFWEYIREELPARPTL